MTWKDITFLIVGFGLGGYASFVASRIIIWYQLKHDVFCRVELLSAIINRKSVEFQPGQHRLDRLLEAKAIEFYFYGHEGAYRLVHLLATEMQQVLDRVGGLEHPNHYEITSQKTAWLRRIAGCRPDMLAFLHARRRMDPVIDFYLSKESEYLRQAKDAISRAGGNVTDLK